MIVNATVGAATPSGFRVVGKTTESAATLRVADNPQLDDSITFQASVSDGIAKATATGLNPDAQWWWRLEDSTPGVIGTVRTLPPENQPADITIGISSCAGGGSESTPGVGAVLAPGEVSNHPIFSTIANRAIAEGWQAFAHLGDLTYYDLGSGGHGIVGGGSPENYRRMIDDVLLQPNQAALYRAVSWVYHADDHDRGPNDHDRTYAEGPNFDAVYRERIPHYPLPASGSTYHAFQIARVLFIVADVRSARDPNTDPDGPSKTMLGAAQRAWMENVLANTPAEFFVWLMPDHWLGTRTDSWGSYSDERTQLVQMFGDLGWLNRMCTIGGDLHLLGMSTGPGNPHGGFPDFLFSPLDSGPASINQPQYDLGVNAERGQYGTLRINDTGSTIEVTGTGYVESQLWNSHTFTVSVSSPPLQSRATITPRVTWLGCDVSTGGIIAELPAVTGTISRALGAETSTALSVPIPLSGPDAIGPQAFQATEPKRTMVVAVINDVPAWAGIVMRRDGGTNGRMDLGCVTPEGYLARRKVRDHNFNQVDEATIMSALARDAEDINGVGQGIGLIHAIELTGQDRDRTYKADDKASVLQRMKELSRVIGGPEWTIDPEWNTDKTRVLLVLRVAERIGVASAQPQTIFQATFTTEGSSAAMYTLTEDHSEGRGANWIVAYSTGEGDARPESASHIDQGQLTAGTPIFEHHFSPGSDIQNVNVLDGHAAGELDRLANGTLGLRIVARWDQIPRLGVDFRLGDDVAWDLIGHRHPDGFAGSGRLVAWELDLVTGNLTPTLTGVN